MGGLILLVNVKQNNIVLDSPRSATTVLAY